MARREAEQASTRVSEDEKTDMLPGENRPRRPLSTVGVLLVGALIGFSGLLIGGAVGYTLGRLQLQAEISAQAAEDRAFLGIGVFDVEEGALIYQLYPDGPGEEGGLLVGDIITHIDGQRVTPDTPIEQILLGYQPGDEVQIEVLRGGEREEIEVVLGSLPAAFLRGPIPGPSGRPLAPGQPSGPPDFGPDLDVPRFPDQSAPFLGVIVGEAQGRGVLIEEVVPGSPAGQAGLLAGDVILTADGERVDSFEDLRDKVAQAGVGGELELEIRRDGARMEIVAIVGTEFPPVPPDIDTAYLGVVVELLTADKADDLNMPYPGRNGVLVVGVEPESPARRVGLRERDVIMSVDTTSTEDVRSFTRAIESHRPGDVVTLVVFREGERDFLEIEVALGARPGFSTFTGDDLGVPQGTGVSGDGVTASIELFALAPGCPTQATAAPCL